MSVKTDQTLHRTKSHIYPNNPKATPPGTKMANLHLFRHAAVRIDPDIESADWLLAPGAEQTVRTLATTVLVAPPKRIVSSPLSKAVGTARILAEHFDCALDIRDGFEEHHRENELFIQSDTQFETKLTQFFADPDRLVFGSETATDALRRFRGAASDLMSEGKGDELVVTHGTIMSLFLASETETAFEIWKSLKMPDCRTAAWPPQGEAGFDASQNT
ncbi:histidine phosphatase family protein [Halovulum sp. GXIMD14793]